MKARRIILIVLLCIVCPLFVGGVSTVIYYGTGGTGCQGCEGTTDNDDGGYSVGDDGGEWTPNY